MGINVLPKVNQILAAARRGQEGWRAWGAREGMRTLAHTSLLISGPWLPSPVVTIVTFKGPVLTVAKPHVVLEGGWQRTGHVTQRALIVVH